MFFSHTRAGNARGVIRDQDSHFMPGSELEVVIMGTARVAFVGDL